MGQGEETHALRMSLESCSLRTFLSAALDVCGWFGISAGDAAPECKVRSIVSKKSCRGGRCQHWRDQVRRERQGKGGAP